MNNWISWIVPFKDPYTYTGKKEETMHSLGWYDYGKRFYDPNYRLSFVSIDPLCEKYYSTSPYVYCMNNPVRYVDPDGKDVAILIAKDGAMGYEQMAAIIQDENGSYHYMTVGTNNSLLKVVSSDVDGGIYLHEIEFKDTKKIKYNIKKNNCADAVQQVLEKALGIYIWMYHLNLMKCLKV